MKIGDTVAVAGKTRHGMMRIKQHGFQYKIVKAIRRPDRLCIESVQTGYKRWIQLNDDKHFGILREL